MSDELQVSLPEGVLRPIIQAQVVSALSGQEKLITEMVRFVLNQQVQDKSYNRLPFLEYVCKTVLHEAIEAAVREWVTTQRKSIAEEVDKQLRAQRKAIAARLVTAVADEAASKWRLTVNVKLGED